MNNQKIHESVMLSEVVSELHINNQAKYIDGTLGTAGHTLEILKRGGKVLGIESDPVILEIAKTRLENETSKIATTYKLINGNFINIDKIARENGFGSVEGILLDLGVTNLHLLDEDRGFSFSNSKENTDLDMRLNTSVQGVKASDLLNVLRFDQLEKMFEVTLDGSSSRWLTKQVIEKRKVSPFKKISDFLNICENLRSDKHSINKATLPFLALRIAVNSELENLREVLPKAYNLLVTGGKLLVITFHSGEEKIVKEFDKESIVILPNIDEVSKNPRARSAKLRVIIKK